MFITDAWNDLLRFVFWMAPMRRPPGGVPPSGGGGGGSKGGGDDDFEKIFRELFEPVYRHFRRLGASDQDAKDLTQETLLRVYLNIEKFRGDSSLKTWIFRIADNIWRNAGRYQRAGKRKREEVSLEGASENGPSIQADRRLEGWAVEQGALEKILEEEQKEKLYEALVRLPPRMRQCVLYRIHHGLKYRQIAERMGISIGTVKAQLSEAEKRLRAELGDYFDSFDLRDDGE